MGISMRQQHSAVAFAVNHIRHILPYPALLDLRKAYDMSARAIIQELIDGRLPPNLSIMILPVLAPMVLGTKHQRSSARPHISPGDIEASNSASQNGHLVCQQPNSSDLNVLAL